ncbi:hypothetical protein Tco_0516193 [Tanacetum coccineum]
MGGGWGGAATSHDLKVDFAKGLTFCRVGLSDGIHNSFGCWKGNGAFCVDTCEGKLTFANMASILVNGSPTSEFKFFRGLKQGDPLAPYLFILIMESLHLSFSRIVEEGVFTGIKIDSSSHLISPFILRGRRCYLLLIGEWSRDHWVWDLNGTGSFQVKDARMLLDDKFLPKVDSPTSCNLAIDISRSICKWWDLAWNSFDSYGSWLSWLISIRMSSNLKKVLEGVFYTACKKEVDMFPDDERVKEKSCMILKEYHEAIQDENNLLCQKAKVEWLKEGDRNTTYFHKTIKERVHRGRIMTIRNEEGIRLEKEDVVLTSEAALKMVRPISDSEIKNAMFEIEDYGYTSRFYKSAWSIVGKEVCQAAREFFFTGKLLGEVNATIISLVPKTPTPDKVFDFRHIACNGRSVNVWHDRWCSVSPLSEFIDTRDVYDARLRQIQVPILDEGNEETALWVSIQEHQFKIRNVWKDMNSNDTKIINEVKALQSNKNIWSIMRRLVCGATVYYIWQKRNNRLFKNEKRDSNTILNIVKEIVKMKLIGIKVKESRTVKEVEERWNAKMQRG